jgi:putative transcriptional regulator
MANKAVTKKTAATKSARRHSVGVRIIEGLQQAVAWKQGHASGAQVTVVQVPGTNVREIRRGMGLSQSEFAAKFGFPLATLQNWEQGRARPDTPTRVLLAVIARHPEAVEDVLSKAS